MRADIAYAEKSNRAQSPPQIGTVLDLAGVT